MERQLSEAKHQEAIHVNIPTEAAKYDESVQFNLPLLSHIEVFEDSQTRDAGLLRHQIETAHVISQASNY